MVEVGEAAVRDDDVRQHVRRLADLLQREVVGVLQGHLKDPEAVAPVGDRCDHVPPALGARPHVLPLAAQDLVVDGAPQCEGRGPAGVLLVPGRCQPHQLLADEIGEQEGHPLRPEPLLQITCHHVDGLSRRRGLRSGEKLTQLDIGVLHDNLPTVAVSPSPASSEVTWRGRLRSFLVEPDVFCTE